MTLGGGTERETRYHSRGTSGILLQVVWLLASETSQRCTLRWRHSLTVLERGRANW